MSVKEKCADKPQAQIIIPAHTLAIITEFVIPPVMKLRQIVLMIVIVEMDLANLFVEKLLQTAVTTAIVEMVSAKFF